VTAELSIANEVESIFERQCDRSCVVELTGDGSSWTKPRS